MRKTWLFIILALIWVLNACESGDKVADKGKGSVVSHAESVTTKYRPLEQQGRWKRPHTRDLGARNGGPAPYNQWAESQHSELPRSAFSPFYQPEPGSAQTGHYRFRPLDEDRRPTPKQSQPTYSQPTYSQPAYSPGHYPAPPVPRYDRPYEDVYEAPQWGRAEPQFRPTDQPARRSGRWTGYYSAPSQGYPNEYYGQWTDPPSNGRRPSVTPRDPRLNNLLHYPGLRNAQIYSAR